jgi:flagellar hook protein FlgE
MGLLTVMNTALSGMSAATTLIDVAADNLANLETPGFKAGTVHFATLPTLTQSPGSPAVGRSAGANPIQIGTGVQVSATDRDFSQGPIAIGNQPALLALEGDGFFILRRGDGMRRYTRDGQFRLSADGELVTADGDRVLGFGIDAEGNVDRSQLTPLTIHFGSSVAGAGGSPAILQSYSIGRDGRIVGRYGDGINRTLGQLRVARFANPSGLLARAGNKFEATSASGVPTESDPGSTGAGEIISGATELSNVDLGHELIELTLAGNMFQANLAVFHTADTLLGELFFPWRR